ncbi:RNA dependent RNA polymerase domain-containing protein [Sarocladium implicatum]|nr:RNA dependent RNA polymerase domain-containing protein [Sarocladium implicatum]
MATWRASLPPSSRRHHLFRRAGPSIASAALAPPSSLSDNWREWPELSVRVHELPRDVTTAMVWDQFHKHGHIVFIEVYESKSSGLVSARIKFNPPPQEDFWSSERPDGCIFNHPDGQRYPGGVAVVIKPDTQSPTDCMINTLSSTRSYGHTVSLNLQNICLGSFTGPRKLTVAQSWDYQPQTPAFKAVLNTLQKKLFVSFHTTPTTISDDRLRHFKMKIDVAQVKNIFHRRTETGNDAFIVPLTYPPEYFWMRDDVSSSMGEGRLWGESDAWYRASCMADNFASPVEYPVAVACNVDEPGYVDLGRWTSCQFVFEKEQAQDMALLREALEDLNIRVEDGSDFDVISQGKAALWEHLDCTPAQEDSASSILQSWSDSVHLAFEVRYQLEVCISRGILPEHNITRPLLEILATKETAKVRALLEELADHGKPIYDPLPLFEAIDAMETPVAQRIPEFCYLVRKAVITPTTIYLNTPTFETSNRVIRKYSHVADRFLKVQFVEEGETGRLRVAAGHNNDEIWKRVWRTLNSGIRVGDRRYEFLAFGNSQLRECGAYFFCPTDHLSCEDIRDWAGDFAHIKVVAKYAARLGQCFSTTRSLRGITHPAIKVIPDIERNGHCFSDGVGKISQFLADFIAAEMPGDDGAERPMAFQFRMGGSKGVLVVSEDAKGSEVHIRPSQEKFKAQFNGLEIIRCARPATATLNRQTITILSSLQVPDGAFISLLQQQIFKYDASVFENAVAIELLSKFVDQNQTALKIAEFIRAGFRSDTIQDPFVLNIFRLWRCWSLKLLKEKARIHVEQSAFVIGCVDETGTLRGHSSSSEGINVKDPNILPQIFLQTVDPSTGKMFVLEGLCVIGRNPSLHPGDIRVVQAVDNPKLRHTKNVVVFPSQGDKPLPSMLSGGDLDGDDFFVIWDPTLIPKIWNWQPMDFTPAQPDELARDVNSLDLRQFFVQYMMNDVLPLIAVAHLAWADELKPHSSVCLELAELHSQAVDYPKTGKVVSWDKRKLWPKRWPHFMDRDSRRSYDSCQVLGLLYDNVTREKIGFEPDWDHAFDRRVLSRYDLEEASLSAARRLKQDYDRAVRRVLAQLSLRTEFELWTGFAMSKPTVGTEYKRQEVLGQESETLRTRFRGLCEEAAGGCEQDKIDPFVAAMYKVTEEETVASLRRYPDSWDVEQDWADEVADEQTARPMPLITFPWLFPEVMVRLAQGDDWVRKRPWYSQSN